MSALGSLDQRRAIADRVIDLTDPHPTGELVQDLLTAICLDPGQYVAQCALSMTCRELALAGLFLARDGVLSDGIRLLTEREAKRVNAVMLTCGTYDSAGDFAYRVGLPAKSGVGGGILAVIPVRGVACVWSPSLGPSGSSAAGLAALDAFTTYSDWTVF